MGDTWQMPVQLVDPHVPAYPCPRDFIAYQTVTAQASILTVGQQWRRGRKVAHGNPRCLLTGQIGNLDALCWARGVSDGGRLHCWRGARSAIHYAAQPNTNPQFEEPHVGRH